MYQVRDRRVAIHAVQSRVNRALKGIGGKNDRHGFPVDGPGGGRIEMTLEAIGIGKSFPAHRAHGRQPEEG